MVAREPDPRRLLLHDEFLRALARRLVRDEATADDLVQETYAAAIERPPRHEASVRGWMAVVLRNAARRLRRGDARRRRREEAVARDEAAPSPSAVLERERARRDLLDAVLRLEAPHRDVILLRFYEDLPPRVVAAQWGVPVETVRTRTRRALDRLRAELDRRHGSRRSWLAVIAPWAGAHPGKALVLGALGMTARTKIIVPLLLALMGAAALWTAFGLGEEHAFPVDGESAALEVATGAVAAPALRGRVDATKAAPAGAPPAGSRAGRVLGVLRGIVRSGRTHEAVAHARIVARPTRGVVPPGMSAMEPMEPERVVETDKEGRFLLTDVPSGAYALTATHPSEGEAGQIAAAAPAAPDAPWVLFYVIPVEASGWPVRFRVTDGETPVPGARVELRKSAPDGGMHVRIADSDGIVEFERMRTVRGLVTATAAPGVARAYVDGRAGPTRHIQELVLRPSGAMRGRVLGRGGPPGGDVRIQAWSNTGWMGQWGVGIVHEARMEADGTFHVAGLPAGAYSMVITGVAPLRLLLPLNESENMPRGPTEYAPLRVDVRAGETSVVNLPLVAGAGVRGRVFRSDTGEPVPGARIEIQLPQDNWESPTRVRWEGAHLWRLDSPWGVERHHPLTFRVLETDADGAYEAHGLLPGPHRITVLPGGDLSFDRRDAVALEDGVIADLVHEVRPAGTLEIVATPSRSLGIRRPGADAVLISLIAPHGAAGALAIPGMEPGTWEVTAIHSDPRHRPIPLATVEVRAGETTFLDLTTAGNLRIYGRLLDGDEPVADAMLSAGSHFGTSMFTDAEGRFEWRLVRWEEEREGVTSVDLPGDDAPVLEARIPADEEFALRLPTGSLRVLVLDTAGRGVPSASVRFSPEVRRIMGDRKHSSGPWVVQGETKAHTDARGAVRWRAMLPGAYTVRCVHPRSGARMEGTAVVADGETEIVLREPPTGSVLLRVLTKNGTPAADVPVSVSLFPMADGVVAREPVHLTEQGLRTGADGTVEVRGLSEGRVNVGAWIMDGHSYGGQAKENATGDALVRIGERIEIVLRLAPLPPPEPKAPSRWGGFK